MCKREASLLLLLGTAVGCGTSRESTLIYGRWDQAGRASYVLGAPGTYGERRFDGWLSAELQAHVWYGVDEHCTPLGDTSLRFFALGDRAQLDFVLNGVPVRGELYSVKGSPTLLRGMVQQPLNVPMYVHQNLNGSHFTIELRRTKAQLLVLRLNFDEIGPFAQDFSFTEWEFRSGTELAARAKQE